MRKEFTRTKQVLSQEEIQKIIDTTAHGVLSLNGDDGYLYTVPLSYVYTDGVVYSHGSPRGYKYECFQRTDKTSFSIVGQSQIVPSVRANNFQSVLIWGRLQPVSDTAEKLNALRALAEKYSPGIPDNEEEIQHSLNYVFMVKLVPEWITGKQAALEVREAAEKL